MNKKTLTLLVLILLAVFIVFGIIAGLIFSSISNGFSSFEINQNYFGESFEVDESIDVDLKDMNTISIDVVSSDVNIYESNSDLEVSLNSTGRSNNGKVKLVVEERGSFVDIKVVYPNSWGGINIDSSRLDIGLPADYNGELLIKGISSEIATLQALQNELEVLDIHTTSGDVDFSTKSMGELITKTTSGDFDIRSLVFESVQTELTSGSIDIMSIGGNCKNVTVRTVSGEVDLVYEKACATEIKTTSGDVAIELPEGDLVDLRFTSTSGDMHGNVNIHDDGVNIDIKTVSGDLKIK